MKAIGVQQTEGAVKVFKPGPWEDVFEQDSIAVTMINVHVFAPSGKGLKGPHLLLAQVYKVIFPKWGIDMQRVFDLCVPAPAKASTYK
jgi:hypothetical protein